MAATDRERLLSALPHLCPSDREWVRVRLALSYETEAADPWGSPPLSGLARMQREHERLIALARQVHAEAAKTLADTHELLTRVQDYWQRYYFGGRV